MGKIIEVNEQFVKDQLGELVRGSVEETLNELLDKEADRLCEAERYEHTEARKDTRAGHYKRKLQTKAGEVTLKVPKLRTIPFETAIIERYRRRECSVEEALMETLTYMSFPFEHWVRIRTNNSLERLMREIRRRTKVVGSFPDGNSALMPAAARLRHVAGTVWSSKKYLNMKLLAKRDLYKEVAA